MMAEWFFVRGVLIGLAIAAPVGPIGVLCIRRTLAHGCTAGLVSGLGAATADMLYGVVAAFGLTAISGLLLAGQGWLAAGGGLFLVGLGVHTFFSAPAEQAAEVPVRTGLWGAYVSTLLLTLTNPATILSFLAIFAGLGLASGASGGAALQLVVGVFVGSALWWLLLTGGVSVVARRLTRSHLVWVNRIAGLVLGSFGVLALVSLGLG